MRGGRRGRHTSHSAPTHGTTGDGGATLDAAGLMCKDGRGGSSGLLRLIAACLSCHLWFQSFESDSVTAALSFATATAPDPASNAFGAA